MGRTKAKNYEQPDEFTCGPTALKTSLEILGIRKSLLSIIEICKTTRNGTPVWGMIRAANKMGLSVLAIEWATLRHLQSSLKSKQDQPRAVIVDYLMDLDDDGIRPHEESGHYATVASYSSRDARIILFDPYTGKKKSYKWTHFLERWYDFDYKRYNIKKRNKKFKLIKKWSNRLMLVLAQDPKHLPKFTTPTAKLFLA